MQKLANRYLHSDSFLLNRLLMAALLIFCTLHLASAQTTNKRDTVLRNSGTIVSGDTVLTAIDSKLEDSLRHRRIKRTILHSTFIPGWGQINNRQAWKVPLVAAAITVPAVLFFNNIKTYNSLKQAYIYKTDKDPTNDALIPEEYQPLSANSIKYYRDAYRQNVDYSALVFILAWGLNVVDAAVFANLKDFDVSDKLSLKLKPQIDGLSRANIALVLTFKNASQKKVYSFQ